MQQENKIQTPDSQSAKAQSTQLNTEISPKLDLSIEGMRSQQFSEGVFAFLLLGIVIFSGIVIAVMRNVKRPGEIKFGERMLFGAIIFGIVVSVLMGAMQMLGGYLF